MVKYESGTQQKRGVALVKLQTSPHLSVSSEALSEWRPSDNVNFYFSFWLNTQQRTVLCFKKH